MSDYFQNKYRIDSHRLKGWDYRTPGWYFVTICTYDGICYFGEIRHKIMGLSEIGCMVWKYWYEIPDHHPHVKLGEYIVMPNHVHMTIRLTNKLYENHFVETRPHDKLADDNPVETRHGVSLPRAETELPNKTGRLQRFQKLTPGSVSIIINQYKGALRTWCMENDHGDFAWQPGFHDHIVRSTRALSRVNNYIRTNPDRWEEDCYHPNNWEKQKSHR